MGSRIRCFWLEPTDQVEMALRRFVWSSEAKCEASGYGYHNAEVVIGRDHKDNSTDVHGDNWPHADPRWPAKCICGYEFSPRDQWQFSPHSLYKRGDTGELLTLRAAPAGAMWNAWWMAERRSAAPGRWVGEDGIALVVMTPGGEWNVDAPAMGGGSWTRSGTPPDVTANPSIAIGEPCRYHGFLRAGWLEEC